jgi:hypothetical protein
MRGVCPVEGRGGGEGQGESPREPAPGALPAAPGQRQMEEEADGAEQRGVDADPPQDRPRRERQPGIEEEDQACQLGAEEGAGRGARGQDIDPAGAPRGCRRGRQGRLRR